jgi:DNA-binding transcriptional LysR family regulator
VSQPSVSAALRKLEAQLGVQLLVRHHAQGVTLTQTGRRLITTARSLLAQAEEWQREAAAAEGEIAGDLAIGSFMTLAPAYLPGLVTEFQRLHPGVRLTIGEGTQDALIEGLVAGRFQLALLYAAEFPIKLDATELASLPPNVLLPARHPLARLKRVPISKLGPEPMVLLDVVPSRSYFLRILRDHGIEPAIAFASPSIELVRGLVARGLGYSLLITRPPGDLSYEGMEIAVRPLTETVEPGRILLTRLPGVRPTRLERAFTEFAVDWFRRRTAALTRAPRA